LAGLDRRVQTRGEISFPAAPALLDVYLRRLTTMFASMGKRFSRAELAALRELLASRLRDGFEQSTNARVHLSWEPEAHPGTGIDYRIWLASGSLEGEYDHWASTKDSPLFGARADAKLLRLAEELTPPRRHRILDLGAGTGRNTFALARSGYAVDAVETTPAFCKALRKTARAERLPIEVVQSNLLSPELELGRERYALVVCSQVTSHFRSTRDLRTLFERAATWTRAGGSFLVSVFVASRDALVTPLARELSQIAWSTVFTPEELAEATHELQLSLVSDESAYEFEKAHQPAEEWPPTSWFESWSRGFNCYRLKQGAAPMELRWLHYRKLERRAGARTRLGRAR
jgi:SAM-dependent methyltransferase